MNDYKTNEATGEKYSTIWNFQGILDITTHTHNICYYFFAQKNLTYGVHNKMTLQ